jgi:hypothetical protein
MAAELVISKGTERRLVLGMQGLYFGSRWYCKGVWAHLPRYH